MILTNHYIKKKIRQMAMNAPFRQHAFCSLDQSRNLLIVYSKEDESAIQGYIQQLKDLNKTIYTCSYVPKGKATDPGNEELEVKEESDINMLLFPKPELVEKFQQLPADILIDVSRSSDYVMKYMVLTHPAQLKVGKKYTQLNLHDFSILTEEENVTTLFEQIIFYLQTIRSGNLV